MSRRTIAASLLVATTAFAALADTPAKLILSGRAVAADGAAADFADVLLGCKDVSCSTDAKGVFRCAAKAAPENDSVCFEHPRFGRARIELEGRRGEVTLGDVKLAAGATIRVTKPPHLELPEGAEVTLLRDGDMIVSGRAINHAIDFNGLKPGAYVVMLEGAQPLQRRAFEVQTDGTAISELFLELDPFRLTGEVALGKSPLKATITLYGENWSAALQSDDDGRFDAELWQSDTYAVTVESGAFRQPYTLLQTASPSDSHWRIAIPSRRIVGRIIDGASGEPVVQATATLQSDTGGTTATRPLELDASGSFEVIGVADGKYTLAARAAGYVAANPVVLDVREFDGDQNMEIALDRGEQVGVLVTNAQGAAIADAAVLVDFGESSLQARIRRTDVHGRLRLDLRKGAEKTIFIVPREGSFAVARVRATDAEAGVRVIVPPGDANLRLETRTTDNAPLQGVGFLLRRGGVEVPFGVLLHLLEARGAAVVTDASGVLVLPRMPAGEYELGWQPPANRTMAGKWIRVTLVPGETVVTQTFAEPK